MGRSVWKKIIFPKSYNVTNGLNELNWTLSSNINKTFKLKVYIGNLHGYMNILGIYDGEHQIAGLTESDKLIDYVFYSDSNRVLINYKFDSNCVGLSCFDYSSFYIEYEELDKNVSPDEIVQTSTCNDFGYRYRQSSFMYYTIASPGISQSRKAYGSNLNCNWTVSHKATTGKGTSGTVYIYGLGQNDYLSIYSGNYTNKVLLNSYTNTYPSFGTFHKYYSITSKAWDHLITFSSDYKNSGRGFFLVFREF